MTDTSPALSYNPIQRAQQLVEVWRSSADELAAAGQIAAATHHRNFAEALETALERKNEVADVLVSVHNGTPDMNVHVISAKGLSYDQIAGVLRDAVDMVESKGRVARNARALAAALTA